jgi:hypothetical protein
VGKPESFGDLMICALEPKAAVEITAVSLKDGAQGLRVVDFGTRPNPFLQASGRSFGVRAGTASAHGVTSRAISACLPPRPGTQGELTSSTEIVVTVERTGPSTGRSPGIIVHFTSDSASGSATFPLQMALCPKTVGPGNCFV